MWFKGKLGVGEKAQEPPDQGMPSLLKKAIANFQKLDEESEEESKEKEEKKQSPVKAKSKEKNTGRPA